MSDFKVSASQSADDSSGAVPAWREKRGQVALAVLGAVVVLGAGGYFLLSAGGGDDGGGGEVVPGARNAVPGASAPVDPSASAAPTTTMPATYDEDPGRNPFAVLYAPLPVETPDEVSVPAPVASAPAANVPVGTNAAPVTNPPAVTTQTVRLKLVKVIDDDTARVSIDGGPAETVEQGVVFAEVFELANTRVDEDEASFRFGDGEQVTLVVGDTKSFVVRS
jgi:hypothetical protein